MKKTLKIIFRFILFERIFFRLFFLNILKRHILGQHTVLELGAGRNSYIKQAASSIKVTAIDLFEPSIQYAKENKIYDFYINGDVNDLMKYFPKKSFDSVVAFDLIEHLTKEDGFRLIENMITVAKQKVIIYTPNGFQPQSAHDNNPFQEHISGWNYDEMINLGFEVHGINGHRDLRKMFANPTIKPAVLGTFISNMSILYLKLIKREDLSFSILCIKNIL